MNGLLIQERNNITDNKEDLKTVTITSPTEQEIQDLIFASKVCKNTKSNTIVFAKNGTLISSGTGQTSRVDALVQAIEKAKTFGFDLNGALWQVMLFSLSRLCRNCKRSWHNSCNSTRRIDKRRIKHQLL